MRLFAFEDQKAEKKFINDVLTRRRAQDWAVMFITSKFGNDITDIVLLPVLSIVFST